MILQARGHVGVLLEHNGDKKESDLRIISRVNTAEGVLCRGVADELPKEAQSVEPTLEDAYLYLITQEGKDVYKRQGVFIVTAVPIVTELRISIR